MREGIAKYSGYEINTEGDSFHVAFMNIADAVAFALETQYKLLEVQWPRDVLRLPSCGKVSAAGPLCVATCVWSGARADLQRLCAAGVATCACLGAGPGQEGSAACRPVPGKLMVAGPQGCSYLMPVVAELCF